ncbi:MAG: efflux RND transporter periplasmic adaptor subunit [Chroococcidiopsidaceae cyanobacterium CP_BM_ER_R8_30]|nr:efflux RND transporter periplasmic adaptor subunit [Chroococcidiopsidaceae cyanobacterium CP_BM_ER_R8_30]
MSAFLLGTGLLISGCGTLPEAATNAQSQPHQTVGRRKPTPVDIAITQIAKVDSELEYTGTTSPVRQVSLRSQVEGQVLSLPIKLWCPDTGDFHLPTG